MFVEVSIPFSLSAIFVDHVTSLFRPHHLGRWCTRNSFCLAVLWYLIVILPVQSKKRTPNMWIKYDQGRSFMFVLSCVCYVFVRVCLYVLCGHLLEKGWPLGSRLWCLLWVCHFPIGILGHVWYLIVSIPDLCTLTYLYCILSMFTAHYNFWISTAMGQTEVIPI